MRKHLSSFFGLLLILLLAATGAGAKTVIDIGPSYPGEPSQPTVPGYVPVEVWASGQPVGGGYAGSGNFYDVIGNRFATDKISISPANMGPLTIQIWTNNQPGGWNVGGQNWGVADIAINATAAMAVYDAYTLSHFPNAVSRFEYGINMQAYASGTPGQPGGGIGNVFAGPVTKWQTSFANVNPVGGMRYGGAYLLDGNELAPVEVRMLEYEPKFTGNMSWVVNDPALDYNNGIPDYLITITFPNFIPAGEFEYLWATARCANDVVVVTPIPGSVWLLGSAFLGLIGIGLRRRLS